MGAGRCGNIVQPAKSINKIVCYLVVVLMLTFLISNKIFPQGKLQIFGFG
jgi:hypothetical protein